MAGSRLPLPTSNAVTTVATVATAAAAVTGAAIAVVSAAVGTLFCCVSTVTSSRGCSLLVLLDFGSGKQELEFKSSKAQSIDIRLLADLICPCVHVLRPLWMPNIKARVVAGIAPHQPSLKSFRPAFSSMSPECRASNVVSRPGHERDLQGQRPDHRPGAAHPRATGSPTGFANGLVGYAGF